MTDSDLQIQIDAARSYDALFVKSLFGPFAQLVADTANLASGENILDVACGTGVLSRAAAARVMPEGTVTGLDLNPGMVAVAGELAPELTFRQGDATELPFEDAAFDAVVSQFGLMFFPEKAAALREMYRVLKPGGRLVVAVWDSLANTPAYDADVAMLQRMVGTAAADALRAPFVLGDEQLLSQLFAEAGVPDAQVDRHPGTADFPSVAVMVEADLRGWMPVMGVDLTEQQIQEILAEAETVLAPFVTGDGRMVFDSPALLVSATKN